MSNFQQYAGETRVYPTYANLRVSNGDIVDFGLNAVPNDGRWSSNAGPATVQLNASVSQAIIPQLSIVSQVYNPGVGAPASGSYTAGETAVDSAGSVFLCTASGTPGTWTSAQSAIYAPLSVSAWVANHAYVAGQEAVDPNGALIVRKANGTSRSTYDATEQALWTTATALTVDGVPQASYDINSTPVTPSDIGAVRTIVEYTTAGTTSGVTVPAGALGVYVSMLSGGGGGGAGRRGAAGTVRCGGGGGACGGWIEDLWIPASLLGATYSVTVAAGGTAGAAATSDNTNGGNGGAGASSTFTSGSASLQCTGAAGGSGGTASTGAASPYTGGPQTYVYGYGVAADTAGGVGASVGDSFNLMPNGGASGGGITAADVAGNGGAGAPGAVVGYSTGAAGGVVGGATPGASVTKSWLYGYSGGGGAASKTAIAQSGASGVRGAGGSGGGASLNGFNSGAGGAGGPGYIRLVFAFA